MDAALVAPGDGEVILNGPIRIRILEDGIEQGLTMMAGASAIVKQLQVRMGQQAHAAPAGELELSG